VLVIQTNAALQSHFMNNVMEFLTYNESPALLDTYTTCQSEHGIADDAGARRATLAVESRMSPVFVHDPRRGDTLAERFSLEGNPDIGKDWITTTLDYLDDDGQPQLREIQLTPADFALGEGRFKKHFRPADNSSELVPIHEFIDLADEARHGKTPFVWSTDAKRELTRLAASPAIVELTEERRRNWRMLEYLGGLHIDRMTDSHREELDDWRAKYNTSSAERENAMDSIAQGMAELAASSNAPSAATTIGNISVTVAQASAPEQSAALGVPGDLPLVEITVEDMSKCTNCKTCYQQASELFEKTKIVVAGETKEVSRVIPGILEKIEVTPDLINRASRVADDCDVEIIRFNRPG
jgi:pyruvate-ferredoxin/flavodoxin oxidoreductase